MGEKCPFECVCVCFLWAQKLKFACFSIGDFTSVMQEMFIAYFL